MIRTIVVGSCVLVQGVFVRHTKDGQMSVRVGDKIFAGTPVVKAA